MILLFSPDFQKSRLNRLVCYFRIFGLLLIHRFFCPSQPISVLFLTFLFRTELMDYFIHLPNHSDNIWDWLLEWAKKEAARKTFEFVERFRLTDEEGGFDVALIGAILQVWLTPEKREEIPHFEPRLQDYFNHLDVKEQQQLIGVLKSLCDGDVGLQEVSITPVFYTTTNRRFSLSNTITSLSNSFNDSPMVSNKKRKLMSTVSKFI